MATPTEIERIAGAISKLRPTWPSRSIRTYLEEHHADRAFADLAVALTVIACDPTSQSPARLGHHGPWWSATGFNVGHPLTQTPGPGPDTPCERPGHEHEPARACRACRAERLHDDAPEPSPGPAVPPPPGFRPAIRRAQPSDPRPMAELLALAPTPLEVVRCRCAGTFTDTPPGRTAHHAVFGHWPEQPATQAATGPGQVKE
jgi:hypothetical protein